MSKGNLYKRTLRLNLNNPQHKRVYDTLLAVEGSANEYIVNAILSYEDSARMSSEEKIAEAVARHLMDNGISGVDSSLLSPQVEIEPNFDFCG